MPLHWNPLSLLFEFIHSRSNMFPSFLLRYVVFCVIHKIITTMSICINDILTLCKVLSVSLVENTTIFTPDRWFKDIWNAFCDVWIIFLHPGVYFLNAQLDFLFHFLLIFVRNWNNSSNHFILTLFYETQSEKFFYLLLFVVYWNNKIHNNWNVWRVDTN